MRQLKMITNNPACTKAFGQEIPVEYHPDDGYLDILVRARDHMHQGWQLLTHPLAGSIKPNQTPYRSLILSGPKRNAPGASPALWELELIESSLESTRKFLKDHTMPHWTQEVRQDFQQVDVTLMRQAVQDVMRHR